MFEPRQKKIKSHRIIPLTKDRMEFLALRYIARYAATRHMLSRVLQRHIEQAAYRDKNFVRADALAWKEAILQRYEEKNWINDGELAQRFIESAQQGGLSKQKIEQSLLLKGVDKHLIQQKLNDAVDGQNFDEMDLRSAKLFMQRKKLGIHNRKQNADPKKDLAKLRRAGFSFETARKALNMTVEDD